MCVCAWMCFCLFDKFQTLESLWRPAQVLPITHQSRDWWCWPVCIQAVFHAGDKFLLQKEAVLLGFIYRATWDRFYPYKNTHLLSFETVLPLSVHIFLLFSLTMFKTSLRPFFLYLLISVCLIPQLPPFSSSHYIFYLSFSSLSF